MVFLNEGRVNEVALRVVLESEEHGREYFDHYEDIQEIISAVNRLVESAAEESAHDGIERIVGIAVVPKTSYCHECGS